ncbi:hypothetical protein D9M71_595410 [compost metagenome]
MTCPGNRASPRIGCGFRKSCCNRPRSALCSITSTASWPRCRPCRPWPKHLKTKCCTCGRAWVTTPAHATCKRPPRSSSSNMAANSRAASSSLPSCPALAAPLPAPSPASAWASAHRSSTATSSACWHATPPRLATPANPRLPTSYGPLPSALPRNNAPTTTPRR